MGQQAGRHLGIYEIVSPLGTGGMGEVYRARDPKLGRDVALKLLPSAMAQDGQSLARLEREARTLAALNHPNIAAIYGLEESDGQRALVMELVEGETLQGRIARSLNVRASSSGSRSGVQPDECLNIAKQIADALEYAHEHGVVHRDLKPANVKITPEGVVKVLDFGLAKVLTGSDSAVSRDPSNSPTLSMAMTQEGFILGTAAYMAPEQAKGKPVDRRADIWAFGCVLYEMLAGQKAFEGETISDVLAAVIRGEPDWTLLPGTTPVSIQRLVRRCLQKDPKQRLQAIGDARLAIEEIVSGADGEAGLYGSQNSNAGRSSLMRRYLTWALGAIAVVSAVLAAWLLLQPRPRQNVVRFPVPQPENATFVTGGEASLSPDGRTLAFVAKPGPDKPPMLWLRPLDSLTAQPIQGTDGAFLPFWSPDSQQIGFFTNDKLEKVAASGGALQVLCQTVGGPGGTWSRDGVILFSSQRNLYRVPDTGGTPTVVLAPDPAAQAMAYSFPQFLPDGRHFLVVINTPGTQENILGAGSLDSKTLKHLVEMRSHVAYAAPGDVFYLDQSTLMARPFDAKALRFTGAAFPVAQSIGSTLAGYGYFSVSSAGVLAYTAEYTAIQNTTGQLTWFNRGGVKQGTLGEPDVWSTPEISPDGTRLAVARGEQGKQDIWVFDLKRGAASRLTFNPADDTNPSWLPGGSQILFSSKRKGPYGIYQKDADGLGSAQVVTQSSSEARAIDDVSPDGRYVIYDTADGPNSIQLVVSPLFGDRKPIPFVQGGFGARTGRFSSNGRYVAYTSNETGRHEVYVQTFPQATGKWQISTAGGEEPMWRRDGKELFYLSQGGSASGGDKVMSVAVDTNAATFQAGIPKELFETQLIPPWYWRNVYAVSPDGQRFLMIVPAAQAKPQPITVVLNWPALLKK
ncbi:MAG TPA: protein kinase [Terracidiphilus sp.]|nr:protein kinase [Terracidiphilus sp.]